MSNGDLFAGNRLLYDSFQLLSHNSSPPVSGFSTAGLMFDNLYREIVLGNPSFDTVEILAAQTGIPFDRIIDSKLFVLCHAHLMIGQQVNTM